MNGRSLLVLDPGHGGTAVAGASTPNRGTGAGGLLEKDVALDLARRTRDRLVADHTVVLTRDGDTNLSLAERALAAKNLGAAIFVSLHLSGADPTADRTDVVVAKAASAPSVTLAENVRRHVTGVTGAAGELLRADLGQIAADRHDPRTAACLVEVASLAPAARAALLAEPAYRDRLADALASAIRESVTAMAPTVTPQWVGARYGRSAATVTPDIDYSVTGLAGAVAIWVDWLGRYAQWAMGVPDSALRTFPHAAICQLKLYNAAGDLAWGTGFYIGDEVLLTCGHNFVYKHGWVTTRVEVQPAYSPRMSVLPSQTFTLDGRTIVHPRWRTSVDQYDPAHGRELDRGWDLAVLRVPGLPATAGVFRLANVSLSQDAGIVVCGYGKVDSAPFEDQGQRMDGAHISGSDYDLLYYPIQTVGGHSGSPVFHESMVVAVHTGTQDEHQNRGVLLTPEKGDWIVGMAGGGVSLSRAQSRYGRHGGPGRSLANASSSQREQSDEVRLHIARSVGLAEAGLRYDLVHDDSNRINFGIGSWTGSRIADVLGTYAELAAELGLTAQLHAHLGGQGAFDALRARFRANGTATTMTPAERAQLQALGRDVALQPAQDRHLANDIKTDLDAIGSQGDPWYPFIDGGMGAISEIAAHVLVHARHQSGGQGLRNRIAQVISQFGGDAALGQAMVAGTVTERDFLDALAARVVAGVQPGLQAGVRNRYVTLWNDWGSSPLAYFFNPSP